MYQSKTLDFSGVSNKQCRLKEAAQVRMQPSKEVRWQAGCRWQEQTAPPSRATWETHGVTNKPGEEEGANLSNTPSGRFLKPKSSSPASCSAAGESPRYVGPLAEITEGSSEAQRLTDDSAGAEFYEGRTGS